MEGCCAASKLPIANIDEFYKGFHINNIIRQLRATMNAFKYRKYRLIMVAYVVVIQGRNARAQEDASDRSYSRKKLLAARVGYHPKLVMGSYLQSILSLYYLFKM